MCGRASRELIQVAIEVKALNALALMRDRLIVFNGAKAALFNKNLTPEQALESARAYYEAFDADHPSESH
ncbi:hypothetical protein MHPYR_180070 [uncultured Mycobacterium sp.]|uniref:Uncharacterized protein n=1 Tax=uncultured Mycobacterium sp. TaxID=171292 RepID=A0A1Y5P537_9MYCO|nr:hypothetical protein MHPYR_180070 [uncultured Mycobacterium sp.]